MKLPLDPLFHLSLSFLDFHKLYMLLPSRLCDFSMQPFL